MVENKLIAEFMGYELGVTETMILPSFIHGVNLELFETSWEYLMPVVEKIEQVHEGVPQELINLSLFSTKTEVYQAVVEFIKQYNETK